MTQENPDDDGKGEKTVPVAALQAETKKRQDAEARERGLETQVAELRGRVDGMNVASPPAAKKDLTRAELRTAVEENKITQEEADSILDSQQEKRVTASAVTAAQKTVDTGTLNGRITDEIIRYKAVVEDLDDTKSGAFQKVASEFKHLVDIGYDDKDLRTEAAALRAAFGPIDALETAAPPREREGHLETGGRSDSDAGGDRQDGYPRGFPEHMRQHYDEMFAKGQYKDKDDPTFKREMKRWSEGRGRSRSRRRAA